MDEPTPAPVAATPTAVAVPKSGPINTNVWQWVTIIGTTTFFIIALYSMHHQIKLTRLQVADIMKKQNASVPA